MAMEVYSNERVSFLADVLTSMFPFSLSPSQIMIILPSQAISLHNSCTHSRFLLCLSLARFFFELEQIRNLVLRQNLKNVSCSSSAHSPDAFRRKDLPAFLDIKIRL